MIYSLSRFAPENLVSRDRSDRPVAHQSARLHTQAESGLFHVGRLFAGKLNFFHEFFTSLLAAATTKTPCCRDIRDEDRDRDRVRNGDRF